MTVEDPTPQLQRLRDAADVRALAQRPAIMAAVNQCAYAAAAAGSAAAEPPAIAKLLELPAAVMQEVGLAGLDSPRHLIINLSRLCTSSGTFQTLVHRVKCHRSHGRPPFLAFDVIMKRGVANMIHLTLLGGARGAVHLQAADPAVLGGAAIPHGTARQALLLTS
jgi:hypothetical protein